MATTLAPPDGDDWQNNLSVLDCNRYMLDNQVACDVTFSLLPPGGAGGDETQIGCHRYVLTSRSPVFFAMFSGPLADVGGSRQRQQQQQEPHHQSIIRISDIAPSTFWQLLRYLYYEELELTDDSVFSVLYAAKKYLVTSLSKRCATFLDSVLSPENVCVYLENLFLFEDDHPSLRQRCFQVIEHQSKRVFHSDSFFEISRDTLCRVLRVEKLSVHEVDVFRACLHWAERRVGLLNLTATPANKRQVLGDALKLIHFPAMNIDEFTKIVVPAGLLSVDEENAIFRTLLGAGNDGALCSGGGSPTSGSSLTSLPFPRNSRNFVSTRCDVTYSGYTRHGSSSGQSLYRGVVNNSTPHRAGWSLTIYCDHSIKIQEIGFFGMMKGNVYVAQTGYRKLEVSSATPCGSFRFGDELQLDAGLFTIGADAPFTSTGDYFLRAAGGGATAPAPLPSITADHDRASLVVREASATGFLSYVVFVPTDEIYFIENYYSDDSDGRLCCCGD